MNILFLIFLFLSTAIAVHSQQIQVSRTVLSDKDNSNNYKARTYLNKIRERAFGDTDHNVTSNGTELTQAIYYERRVEFVGESHHFFDLVRTKRAEAEIDNFTPNKNEIFPIPLVELELANAKERWGQNLGY